MQTPKSGHSFLKLFSSILVLVLVSSWTASASAMPSDQQQHVKWVSVEQRLDACNQKIEQQPENAALYAQRAYIYREQKVFDKAIADLTKAITLDPTKRNYYFSRAAFYDLTGRTDLAVADCTTLIAMDQTKTDAYNRRSGYYKKLKNYPAALSDYDRVIALEPDKTTGYYNRAYLYCKLQKYDLAIADYTKIISLRKEGSKDVGGYIKRADTYYLQKKYDLAIADCNQALTIYPLSRNIYQLRSCAYLAKGQTGKAKADLEKILQLNRDNVY
jgi:tetratricopeptide (TPR) repeat protein